MYEAVISLKVDYPPQYQVIPFATREEAELAVEQARAEGCHAEVNQPVMLAKLDQ